MIEYDGPNGERFKLPELNLPELEAARKRSEAALDARLLVNLPIARRFNEWVIAERTRIEIEALQLREWLPLQGMLAKAAIRAGRAPSEVLAFCESALGLLERERRLKPLNAYYLRATKGEGEHGARPVTAEADEDLEALWLWFWAAEQGQTWGEL